MTSQIKESREQLVRAEKDAAWREMARQVAHESKNPLTPIQLSAERIATGEVEVVSDDHQITRRVRGVHTTRRVRQEKAPCPGRNRGADAEHDLIHVPPFVGMDPAGQNEEPSISDGSADQ